MTSSKVLMAAPMCRAAIAAYLVGFVDLEAADAVSPSREGWRWTSAASSAASSCLVVAAVRLEPDFRGSTLHHRQLAGHSAAVGFAVGFVAAFGASVHGIVAASASSFADNLVAVRAVVAVGQVAVADLAAVLAVVGLAGLAAVGAAAAAIADQGYLPALTQVQKDPMVLLKGSCLPSREAHFYNQRPDRVTGASCRDPS